MTARKPLQPGDIVVYREDALLYGKMLILSVGATRVLCEQVHADKDGEYARDLFDPGELERFETWEIRLPVP